VSIFRVIFKQTFWQIIGKIITSISTFIILGIIARNYHEAGAGIFTLVLTYLTMFNLLVDFGFNAHVLRKGQWQWNKLFGTRILWSLVLVILAISTLFFWPFANAEFKVAVVFGSLAVVGSAVFITCNLIFQSKLRYDFSVLSSGTGTLIGLLFYILLSSKNYPVAYLLLAHSISWLSIALFSLILVKKYLSKLLPSFDYQYTQSLFKDSWPLAATLALNVVYFRVDSFLLASLKGISEVGIYNVSYSIFQSALVLPTFIMNAYYPLMLKSFAKIKIMAIFLAGLSLAGSLLTWIWAPILISVLTGGKGFEGSIQSLQILSLSFPAFFLSSLLMWFFLAKGMYKKMLVIYFFGLVINLGLNSILIQSYSFYGASYVTVISEYLILIMQIFVLRGILHP